MKALCWYGKAYVRVETVPDPKIINPRDVIIRITTTAICGSDLHLYDGYIPTMEKGEIDPSFLITHRMRLEDAPAGYEMFKQREDNCIKIVLKT